MSSASFTVVGPPLRLIQRRARWFHRAVRRTSQSQTSARILEAPDRADLLEAEPAQDRVRGVRHSRASRAPASRARRRSPSARGRARGRRRGRAPTPPSTPPIRKTPRSDGTASAVPAGRPSTRREKADGDPDALRLLEVLAEPRPVLRAAVLRRVERVPLQLARRGELLERLDARDVDSRRARRLAA